MKTIRVCFGFGLLVCSLLCSTPLIAQPIITSNYPPNMAAGVSPTTPVVFVFSQAMNPALTTIMFMDSTTYNFLTTTPVWSSENTVLTCTPVLAFPVGHMIVWSIDGESATGAPLGGTTAGMFTAGGGDSGCSSTYGPLESFTVAKGALYQQTSTAVPASDANCPFNFVTCLWLACPHTATNVTLTPQGGAPMNIPFTSIPGHPLLTVCGYTTQSDLDAAYPPVNYTFTMKSVNSNQSVTMNLPSTLAQPPAPYITNYAAAQAIDPSQPFRLGWEPFAGGTTADCIYFEALPNGFQTPALGEAGALNGLATSIVIPPGTLQTNTSYSASVTFYHYVLVTNSSNITLSYRAAVTEFTLQTTAGVGSVITITNATCTTDGSFSFDVACAPGLSLLVERNTQLTGQWQPFHYTNTSTARFHVSDSGARSSSAAFYRVRTYP